MAATSTRQVTSRGVVAERVAYIGIIAAGTISVVSVANPAALPRRPTPRSAPLIAQMRGVSAKATKRIKKDTSTKAQSLIAS